MPGKLCASYTSTNLPHAFLYSQGRMIDLGTLGGNQPGWTTVAYGINRSGVVGYSYTAAGLFHAFAYLNGTMHDLGTLGGSYSQAFAINDAAQITVGEADVKNNTGFIVYHAAVFQNGVAQDLNQQIPAGTGWILTTATSINDNGQLVGVGTLNGAQHAFLLQPR